mgnify:CR=1 FL=1
MQCTRRSFGYLGSGNIADDFLGRKIELLRLAQELFEVLHDGRVIEAVDDTLVRIHDEVDIAARHGLALQVELDLAVLTAKGDEDRKVAEVIEVVDNRRDAKRAHGREDDRAMEGAEVRQKRRQQAEVVQRLQEPDNKLQQEPRHTGQQSRDMVERAVERGVFDLVDEGVQLLIDLLRRVRRLEVELDGRLLAVRAHVLLDGTGELANVIALIDALAGEEAVHAGVLCDAADIGRKQHMRQTEGLHAFRALLADVALDLRNFERCLDGVAGIVARGHDIWDELGERGKGTEKPAFLPVAEAALVCTHI